MTLPAWLHSVYHNGSAKYISQLYPRRGDTLRLRLRTALDAPVRRVYLRTAPDGEQAITRMSRGTSAPHVQWWDGDLPIREPVVHYRFLLEADDGLWWYTANGPVRQEPLDLIDFRILANYQAPSWLRRTVFYQIFPDRFANGDPATNARESGFTYGKHRPKHFAWNTPPDDDTAFPLTFYGGDLPGIRQRLDYLQDIGVDALYLNPIFTAPSNHKYDVADYDQVDAHLGGNEALIALRRALTECGMRYMLDIVPNHCGYWHSWFAAARADASAPEADFFTFRQHPDDYETWLGVWTLPKLNYRSHELRQRMYEAEDAVLRKWLKAPYAADAWRIDAVNMLGRQSEIQLGAEVVRGIRQAVKETAPDAYLLGENFFDATAQLQGDQLDGVMNYIGFAHPLLYWLSNYQLEAWGMRESITSPVPWSTEALVATWRERMAVIPWQIALQQFNLLTSHDTPRMRSRVRGNDALHRLAAMVQFTFPGLPCIYYGDEIGMMDDRDLAQRGCMVWDEAHWDVDLRDFYRSLIRLRRSSDALQLGGFQILAVEPDCIAYQREGRTQRVIVVANRSATPRPAGPLAVAHGDIPDGAAFVEHFSGRTATVSGGMLPLPALPQGAMLWKTRN